MKAEIGKRSVLIVDLLLHTLLYEIDLIFYYFLLHLFANLHAISANLQYNKSKNRKKNIFNKPI